MTLVLPDITEQADEQVSIDGSGASEACASARPGRSMSSNRPTPFFGGRTRNISTTGLRIELPYSALEPGDVLNVHVDWNRDGSMLANRRQMIPAKVVVDHGGL